MRRYSLLLILAGLIVGASCQTVLRTARVDSPPPDAQIGQKKLMPYPQEVVWSALVDLFNSRGWTITTSDRTTGNLATGHFNIADSSAYSNCPAGQQPSLYDYRAQLDITVTRVTANGTDVIIAGQFDAADSNQRESQPRVKCESNGRLEVEVFAAVDSVIAARK